MLISVITVNFNNKLGLEKTIQSVKEQNYPHIEYIIVDGLSTDGSIDILGGKSVDVFISEQDRGPYDAMNKGIDKAKGDYLLFLNSGDYLTTKTVIQDFVNFNTNEDLVYGDTLVYENGKPKRLRMPKKLTLGVGLTHTINHQTIFFNKRLFENGNRYDLDYRIVADWVFVNEILKNRECTTRHIDLIIPVYDLHGISSDSKLRREEREIYFSKFDFGFKKLHEDYVLLNAKHNMLTNNFFIKILLKVRSLIKKT